MPIPHDALVLVADGRKYLLLRNKGDAIHPDLHVEAHQTQNNPATRDQGSDAPGRAFSSVGSGRSAMEQTDFHQLEEDRFAADVADKLRALALAGDFEKLIVVAPPRTLGELRKRYHKEVQSRLAAEFDKDLTGHSIESIERLLNTV